MGSRRNQLIQESENIYFVKADSNYTYIYFKGGKREFLSITLKEIDQLLQDSPFYRIHQSYLINLKYLNAVVTRDKTLFCSLKSGHSLPVSRSKRKTFINDVIKARTSCS